MRHLLGVGTRIEYFMCGERVWDSNPRAFLLTNFNHLVLWFSIRNTHIFAALSLSANSFMVKYNIVIYRQAKRNEFFEGILFISQYIY